MKKIILSCLFLSASAKADVITCYFTEPFVTTIYSMTKSTLSFKEAGSDKVQVIKNVSFQIKDAGVFELLSSEGKVLQTLTLNFKGSDGMSDNVFPFEVKDSNPIMTANLGYGGCFSNHLKIKILD